MKVKIENFDLIRDTSSMAIVNDDTKEREEYFFRRNLIKNHKKDYDSLNEKIEKLNSELLDLKTIVLNMVEK